QNASVILEGNGFNIVTRGRVLEHGCADELVRVRLPSRKIVRARVLNSKTLQVPRQGEKYERSQ
ncbi:MAG: flagella basal body P-ring formation protein FlgA, partial [Candidatus Hydrogenedentota bacterium]